jgi:hypothetical protein
LVDEKKNFGKEDDQTYYDRGDRSNKNGSSGAIFGIFGQGVITMRSDDLLISRCLY